MNIVAYGSLVNKISLQATLGREVEYKLVEIEGFTRIFNAPFGKYAFLNLTKKSKASMLVAYFYINKNELCKFEIREAGSKLVEVKPKYYAFVWPSRYCQLLPALQSYIDICEDGCITLGLDFWKNTILPQKIINDRNNPRYPE